MRTLEVKECQKTINDYFMKGGFAEVQNGNTPSPLSPTSSVGSQVSTRGSLSPTTPIGLTLLFTFLIRSAELWFEHAAVFSGADSGAHCVSTSEHVPQLPDHVSRIVGNGRRDGDQGESHRFVSRGRPDRCPTKLIPLLRLDFFVALDQENGPITLHSSLSKVVKYIQSGLQKLKQM